MRSRDTEQVRQRMMSHAVNDERLRQQQELEMEMESILVTHPMMSDDELRQLARNQIMERAVILARERHHAMPTAPRLSVNARLAAASSEASRSPAATVASSSASAASAASSTASSSASAATSSAAFSSVAAAPRPATSAATRKSDRLDGLVHDSDIDEEDIKAADSGSDNDNYSDDDDEENDDDIEENDADWRARRAPRAHRRNVRRPRTAANADYNEHPNIAPFPAEAFWDAFVRPPVVTIEIPIDREHTSESEQSSDGEDEQNDEVEHNQVPVIDEYDYEVMDRVHGMLTAENFDGTLPNYDDVAHLLGTNVRLAFPLAEINPANIETAVDMDSVILELHDLRGISGRDGVAVLLGVERALNYGSHDHVYVRNTKGSKCRLVNMPVLGARWTTQWSCILYPSFQLQR